MNDKKRNEHYQAQQAIRAKMQKDVSETPHWAIAVPVTKKDALPLAKRIVR